MRPVRLELEGFTSFRQSAVVDFGTLDLFAITGATGAGKTSLIDGILFALYGRTPRIGRGFGDLISQGSAELKVLLEFRAGSHLYRAFRHVKRKGAGKQRIDQKIGDDWETLADKSNAMDAKVHELLGLDFEGFTKTVVLPQGEFDRFLRGEAAKRREILIELLGLDIYAQMMRKANESAARESDRARLLEEHLNRQLAGCTPERVSELESQLEAVQQQALALQDELDRVNAVYPLQGRLKELKLLAAQRLQVITQLQPLVAAQKSLAAAAQQAQDQLGEAESALDGARERATALEGEGSADLLRRKAQDIRKAIAKKAEIAQLKEALAKGVQEWADLRKRLQESEAALQAANDAVLDAIQSNAADQLREHLHAGEECPVCEQIVLLVPEPKGGSTVDQVKQAAAAAKKAHDALQAAVNARTTQIKATEVQIKSGERDLVDTAESPESYETKAAAIDAARVEFRKLETEIAAKRKSAEQARNRLAEADTNLKLLEQRRDSLETQLAGAESVEELERKLGEFASKDLEAERRRVQADLQARQRLIVQTEAAIEQSRKLLEEAVERRAEIRERNRSAEIARKLGTMLQANGFQTFVLAQTLRRLAIEGTRQLMHLSSNRYSFSTEGDEFLVVDHWNADEKRSVNTLSGGESFLASLSLALALSKSLPDFSVNRDAIHLDSLFLDEGFSTLDTETMQIVLDAIELLQADGRMIGVVSHIPELAERLPARIEVSKSQAGSTVAIR